MSKVVFLKGDMFESTAQALICPTNCQGVMGAGVAKLFRDKFNNQSYKDACIRGEMSPGSVHIRQPAHVYSDTKKTLIYMATKFQWKNPSEFEWIEMGLWNLQKALSFYNIPSVAIPALGAGLGGLSWEPIKNLIERTFVHDNESKTIEVFEPL